MIVIKYTLCEVYRLLDELQKEPLRPELAEKVIAVKKKVEGAGYHIIEREIAGEPI